VQISIRQFSEILPFLTKQSVHQRLGVRRPADPRTRRYALLPTPATPDSHLHRSVSDEASTKLLHTTPLAVRARSPNSLDNRLPATETNSTLQFIISFA